MKGERGRRVGCRSVRDERGQVVVLFALLIPTLLALTAVVLDIGNMYVHKKHNQTLVDAAAFAGATKFVGCSFQFGNPAAANFAIKETALQYAGDTHRGPGTYNLQVQKPDDVRVVLNGATFWNPGDGMDGEIDDTLDPDGNPATPGDPCSTKTLDVKATDHDVPLLTGLFPFKPDAKSRARVEIHQVLEQNGMLPWAVPEVDPAAVAALFVNENNGSVIAQQRLMQLEDATLPFLEWSTSPPTDPFGVSGVDLANENTGVVILISKTNATPSLSGTLSSICGQSPGLVQCYAGSGGTDGLTFIHGWSDAPGAPANAQIRDFSAVSVTCGDDLSNPYFLREGDCDLGALAVIDFGVTGNPSRRVSAGGIDAEVTLRAPGCGGSGCPMTWVSTSGTQSTWSTGSRNATLIADRGRTTFSIDWSTSTGSGTFPGLAHPYVGNDASGPVEYLKLRTADPGIGDPNSRNTGDPALASVIVTVGLRRPFQVESPLAPGVVLRVGSPSGSQNQAFDCDKSVNFEREIENGCQTTYRENYGDWNGDGVKEWRDIFCADWPNGIGLPPDTLTPAPVPDCVRIETGDKIGQFRQGLDARLKTPACAPNNWPERLSDFPDFFSDYDFANDPRYVTLVVTDYGRFLGAGSSEAVPVKYFAGFYITGWDKVGNAAPCSDNEQHPWYGGTYRKSLDNGDVWGHFINVTVFSSAGLSDDELCNFDEIGTCIAVLVE
jgi:Putative Flp pilus-assembly TadE/G-like